LWAKHTGSIVDIKLAYTILVGKHEKDHLADICIDERVILKFVMKKEVSGAWIGFVSLKMA
jgi:hypothetical protein